MNPTPGSLADWPWLMAWTGLYGRDWHAANPGAWIRKPVSAEVINSGARDGRSDAWKRYLELATRGLRRGLGTSPVASQDINA